VIGPRETVSMPPQTLRLDWEVELAVVIGRRARRVSVERALSYAAGYTIVNDIPARDLNTRSDYLFKFDWFQGKCHDTFAPFGPWRVPAWLIRDPHALRMTLTVSGTLRQDDLDRPHDLERARADRLSGDHRHAGAGRRDRHRHAGGCGHGTRRLSRGR